VKSDLVLKLLDIVGRPGSITEEGERLFQKKIFKDIPYKEYCFIKIGIIELIKTSAYLACNNPQILFYFS